MGREFVVKSMKQVKILGARIILPPVIQRPIWNNHTYYVMCRGRHLDNHSGMIWTPPDGDLCNVGKRCSNIQWKLAGAGRSDTYHIINVDRGMYLDGNIEKGSKVRLWVSNNGIGDIGKAPQFIQWKFVKAPGTNKYFLLNVGKQRYLDSNGME